MMENKLYVLSLSNGRDIIANLAGFEKFTQGKHQFGDLFFNPVFYLEQPRIIMMQPSPGGIRVGMAPVNIDSNKDGKVYFQLSTVSYIYPVSNESDLAKNYFSSLTKFETENKTPVSSAFVAH